MNKDNSGVLFKAEKKSDKHPDYTGNCLVSGKKMYIAAWVNESKDGKKYMSLSFTEPSQDANYKKEDSSASAKPEFSTPNPSTGSDDALPF